MPSDGGADRSRPVRGTEYGGRARLKKSSNKPAATTLAIKRHRARRHVAPARTLC